MRVTAETLAEADKVSHRWPLGVYGDDPAFKLSRKARRELAEFFALDPGDQDARPLLREVRRVLSQYPSMAAARDAAPRPARCRTELDTLRERVDQLMPWLLADPHGAVGELLRAGLERRRITALVAHLERLDDAAVRALKALKGKPSRHGPTRRARNVVALRLACLFDFFRARVTGRDDAATPHDLNEARREFVMLALQAGGIPVPQFTPGSVDTPATSRLARMLPRRCERCWAAGLEARASHGVALPPAIHGLGALTRTPREARAALLQALGSIYEEVRAHQGRRPTYDEFAAAVAEVHLMEPGAARLMRTFRLSDGV
jgi:hypothetical protein